MREILESPHSGPRLEKSTFPPARNYLEVYYFLSYLAKLMIWSKIIKSTASAIRHRNTDRW